MKSGRLKTSKKAKTKQFNFRPPDYLIPIIATGAKAAGLSQTAFIEYCVAANDEKVIAMTAAERELHLQRLRGLKENAKQQKLLPGDS